ncbi:MAG: endonuclease domain-containing protein [bacterium]
MTVLKGPEDYPFYFGAKPETLRLAAELRNTMTEAEKILWKHLRNRQLAGCRFRRQHPVNEFIIDFFCYEAMIAVEVDGEVHNDLTQIEYDIERTRILNQLGIMVIRFSNRDVESNINDVVKKIIDFLKNK